MGPPATQALRRCACAGTRSPPRPRWCSPWKRARGEADLVATVGKLEVSPGAVNVIPGEVRFSIDLRSPDDWARSVAFADLTASFEAIAVARDVRVTLRKTHEASAFICDQRIVAGLTTAVERLGIAPRLLPSGAGHDTMVMGGLCPAGMLFVRCKGGVSHNPLESITLEDCIFGLAALMRFVREFRIS